MKWLEIIELRSVDINRELLESQLQKLINKVFNNINGSSRRWNGK
jgi:glutamate mutase epsilon subunit